MTDYFPYWWSDRRLKYEFAKDGYGSVSVERRRMTVPGEIQEEFAVYLKQKERAAIDEAVQKGLVRDEEFALVPVGGGGAAGDGVGAPPGTESAPGSNISGKSAGKRAGGKQGVNQPPGRIAQQGKDCIFIWRSNANAQ